MRLRHDFAAYACACWQYHQWRAQMPLKLQLQTSLGFLLVSHTPSTSCPTLLKGWSWRAAAAGNRNRFRTPHIVGSLPIQIQGYCTLQCTQQKPQLRFARKGFSSILHLLCYRKLSPLNNTFYYGRCLVCHWRRQKDFILTDCSPFLMANVSFANKVYRVTGWLLFIKKLSIVALILW